MMIPRELLLKLRTHPSTSTSNSNSPSNSNSNSNSELIFNLWQLAVVAICLLIAICG